MTVLRVTVLGLGTMGAGMAAQLIAAGFDVTVWNRSPDRAEPLVAAGARRAASPAEAAGTAEVVIAMLADDDASRSAWLGADGALSAMQPGAIAIECSTLTHAWVKTLAAEAATRGLAWLDAPVTGSRLQAQEGSLRFLVGGEAAVLERAGPVLAAMGTDTAHLGPAGSGALFKLVNNFLCGVQVASLAEAVTMLERSGLDAGRAVALLADGAPGSPLLKMVSRRMLERDYTPNFFLPLMAKDLAYAQEAFAAEGIELASAGVARRRFETAAAAGWQDDDMAAVIEPVRSS
ncbi:3-hydroxyisobutyrate dehydrogenase [Croceibacterium mercuriale]|uniref:3-hydroxyisobutyrate dehydrogenase n=1 Tax=Croceibacterium mercuriale TaxID=1572751 RepID=A0A0B2BYN2_9SPHN|nr:NAD(P)-dependent oxidoreductase [Croceibacterium mercuriale]KHL24955.1 3-hydroxyisobutyrate dehydrogenase [Croceibacterium mercuriale]